MVGDLLLDVIASGRGHDARIHAHPGGSAANAAVWAAWCGADAAVVGWVGADAPGRALTTALEERGVRTELTVVAGAATGTFLLVDGDRRIDRGANALAEPELLPRRLEADVALVSTYLPEDVAEAAVRRARASWVAVDAGGVRAPPAADAVFVNEQHARVLTGEGAEGAARALGRRYRLACVTRAREGAVAVLEGRAETASPADVYDGDATGAGDAFAAALLVSLARGATLSEALVEGCRCGALAAASPDGWPVSK